MEKEKKILITKIVVSILAVVLAIACIIIISTHSVAKYDGKITLEVVTLEDKKVIDRTLKFNEGDTVLGVLGSYSVPFKMGTGKEEGMIISIGGINQDGANGNYIMIYIDNEYATVGIKDIKLVDGMVLKFKLEHFDF